MLETDATPDALPATVVRVTLIVRSTDTSFDTITASLGASPTSTKRRGERVPLTQSASVRRTENMWIFDVLKSGGRVVG